MRYKELLDDAIVKDRQVRIGVAIADICSRMGHVRDAEEKLKQQKRMLAELLERCVEGV